jgi:hypothetical protein
MLPAEPAPSEPAFPSGPVPVAAGPGRPERTQQLGAPSEPARRSGLVPVAAGPVSVARPSARPARTQELGMRRADRI